MGLAHAGNVGANVIGQDVEKKETEKKKEKKEKKEKKKEGKKAKKKKDDQNADDKESHKPAKLFKSDDILEIILEKDFKAIKKDIKDDRDFHPGKLTYIDENGGKVVLNVQLRTRGKSRRDPRVCNFPPLTVKFNKDEVDGTLFRKIKRLKLVTPCKRQTDNYQQYLLKEYLVYKFYNLLTPRSYRVRLIKATYIDSAAKYEPMTRYCFFIEESGRMAKRNDGSMDKTDLKYTTFQQKEEQMLMSVFQYMIGNTDWSIPARHNIRLLRANPNNSLYAVPYDFDMCGLVNAGYAVPNEKIQHQIKEVTQRLYRGLCRTQSEFDPVLKRFRDQKEKMYALVNNLQPLEPKAKQEVIKYLDEFFETINDPQKVKRELVERCKRD